MITSWRIVAKHHSDGAFTGEGANRYPGRWNARGNRVIYTAQSAALAALEMLVHLDSEASMRPYVLFACTFASDLVERVERKRLPARWKSYPPPGALNQLGSEWLASARTAVLQVPSAVIETEWNYLLNPEHPDFPKITIADPIPFSLDLRLLRR
ncbi:MAG: RES family NAD+ phosphorylase [Thermoanaerobaculia bacterium]